MTQKRIQIKFFGTVQGVGFRPFIYRTATRLGLTGFVKNLSDSVLVEIEGEKPAVEGFLDRLKPNLPPLAAIEKIEKKDLPPKNDKKFEIRPSEKSSKTLIHISPDIAVCKDCLNELYDPGDRRYLYPFINCTNCGPRFTIIKDIPYDRRNTSMAVFEMCDDCRKEYEDPLDRRFHAEPIACAQCGPRLTLLNRKGEKIRTGNPIEQCAELLTRGKIVAIKGLGGFHLAADATSAAAVARLRKRKHREEKALALMVKDIGLIETIARVDETERKLLLSPQCPIVLLRKKKNQIIADNVAPGLANYGIMLPYTPLHHLLLERIPYLVMTSGNQTDEPICIKNTEALTRLRDIADCFLVHDREILLRCDDSILMRVGKGKMILRRARGFVPSPITLTRKFKSPVLALGAHMKNTICLVRGHLAFLSPHIGDLQTPKARDFLLENVALLQKLAEASPEIIVCDLHPSYATTRMAEKMAEEKNAILIKVQHHHAHIVSCMVENRVEGSVIGFSFDGTGYGLDGKIWGGEVLVSTLRSFERAYHLQNFLLPGGEKAIKEIWRIGVSLVKDSFPENWKDIVKALNLAEPTSLKVLDAILSKKILCIETSSMGRLFDGVSAILGCRKNVSYEGQGAMELESISRENRDIDLRFQLKENLFDHTALIRKIVNLRLNGESVPKIAYAFHRAVVDLIVDISEKVRAERKLNRVVLTGGCFQNRILLTRARHRLRSRGFNVLIHEHVPCNDGGISLGQAMIATAKENTNGKK